MKQQRVKIWGPPGTGKTTKLLEIVMIELEAGREPSDIIYTSFTRAACNVAVTRALNEFGLHAEYKREDFPYFRTEHAICFKLLGLKKDQVFTGNWLEEFANKYPVYRYSANNAYSFQDRNYELMLQTLGDYYEFFMSWMDSMMLPFDQAIRTFINIQRGLPADFAIEGAREYMRRRDEFKLENKLWDFTDMLNSTIQKGLVPKCTMMIADEMQDASPLLWKLIEMWSQHMAQTYVAGDPYQSIYTFAGASPELFFDFKAEQEILAHSYRLTPQIKDFAQRIITLSGLEFPKFTTDGRQGSITYTNTIDWAKLGPAFLLSRTRWYLREFSVRLQALGIPYTIERGPESPLTSSKGTAFLTLLKLSNKAKVNADELRDLARHTRAPWLVKGAKTKIKMLANAEYSMKEIEHFFTQSFKDVIHTENFVQILNQSIDEADTSYLSKVFRNYGVTAFQKVPDLILTTIHGSKGREKPTVILSPEMGRKAYANFLLNKQSEVFVAYVAATRTMGRLIILPRETPESFPYPDERKVE